MPLAAICSAPMGGSEGVTARRQGSTSTIRIWSAPLVLANYVVLGWLIGQARATLALGLQIAINLINMAATVLLVLVLDAGIAGAAIGRGDRRSHRARARLPDRAAAVARTACRSRARRCSTAPS